MNLSAFVDLDNDFANKGQLSLSKALLASVCAHYSDLQIYRKYIEQFEITHTSYNISALKRFSERQQELIHKSDFKFSSPSEEPNFFSFFSHSDVNRLARLLPSLPCGDFNAAEDHFIVIYFCDNIFKCTKLEYFHDFRCLTPDAPNFNHVKVYFYMVTATHNLYKLKNHSESAFSHLDTLWMPQNISEYRRPYFARHDQVPVYQVTTQRQLGGLLFDVLFTNGISVEPEHFQSIDTIESLMLAEDKLAAILANHLKLLIVVTYGRLQVSEGGISKKKNFRLQRLLAKTRNNRLASLSPANSYFSTLFSVGGHKKKSANQLAKLTDAQLEKDVMVICLFAGAKIAVRLENGFARHVVNNIVKPVHRDKHNLVDLDVLHLAKKNLSKKTAASAAAEEAAAAALPPSDLVSDGNEMESNEDDDDDDDAAEDKKKEFFKNCKCPTCFKSKEYDDNMSTYGPEQLTTTPFCLKDLLELLGQDTPEHLAILDQLLDMSVAAMDIESMTVPLHVEKPTSCAFNYHTIEKDIAIEDHSLFVQKPIMICHMDWLSRMNLTTNMTAKEEAIQEEGLYPHLFFQAQSNNEHSIYSFIKEYWLAVKERQTIISQKKHDLAKPLWNVVHAYKKTHYAFHGYWAEKYPKICNPENIKNYCLKNDECDSCSSTDNSTSDSDASLNEEHPYNPKASYIGEGCEENSCRDVHYLKQVVEKSWKRSLPGKLAEELQKLMHDYCIFSFYG